MTTRQYRAQEIVVAALRKIGVVARDEPGTAEDIAEGVQALEWMLKSWQNEGHSLWTQESMSVAATTATSVLLTPRPVRVQSVSFKRGGIETPMQRLTRAEYDDLPIKTSTGIPTTFYFDRQAQTGRLYVWPVLSAVNGETYELTVERELADITDTAAFIDVPSEWYEAVVYGLADRLMDDYEIANDRVSARAAQLLAAAFAADREESVFFT